MSRYAIGLDVGGTSARVGLVSEAGKLLYRSSARTGLQASGEVLLERFRTGVGGALTFARERGLAVAGIGVAMPAFVDEAGCVTGSCNLPGLNGAAVSRLLGEEFGLPVGMENDVSAGACGEYHFGGWEESSRRLLFLSVGTGIGGGMMVDGKLLRLAHGCLGDPGHVIVDPSGESPCRCGGNGCMEAVASGWALVERAGRLGVEATPKQIFERARRDDRTMAELAERAAAAVGVGLASLTVLLNPDTIVLGGGVAMEAGEGFLRRAEETLRAHAVPLFSSQVRVAPAKLGGNAGLLGAASVALFRDND